MKKIFLGFIVVCSLSVLVAGISFAQTDEEYNNALKYYNSGKYKEAVNLLKEYIKKNPNPAAYYRIGYALYKIGQFDEANEYFKETYLLDPDFSPDVVGLVKEQKEITMPAAELEPKAAPQPKKEPVPAAPEPKKEPAPAKKPEKKPESPVVQSQPPAKETPAPKPKEPAAPPVKKEPIPETQKVEPQPIQPPPGFPPMQSPGKQMPFPLPKGVVGALAGFLVVIVVVAVALYLFFCLCMFLIAKKLNVPAAWAAWVPIVNAFWPLVGCAGKPWWWVLIILGANILTVIPLIGLVFALGVLVLYTYLWICTTENLGRNKWLGLLTLVPIVNIVFIAILAFSKTEETRTIEITPPAEEV